MYLVQKKIGNETYYYLVHNVRLAGDLWKKITIYVGKDLTDAKLQSINQEIFSKVKEQEILLRTEYMLQKYKPDNVLNTEELKKLELIRIQYNNAIRKQSDNLRRVLFDKFMARFIYESNAIEGSKLPLKDVIRIVHEKEPSKEAARNDVQEVKNSIAAFEFVNSNKFAFNHLNIIKLQRILLSNASYVNLGYRKIDIIVGNSTTSNPENIKKEMTALLDWYKFKKNIEHPVKLAFNFHIRFEHIHPFEDGNGRTGRVLMNKVLMDNGYPPLIVKNSNRKSYFNRFEKSAAGKSVPLERFLLRCLKNTFREFFEGII